MSVLKINKIQEVSPRMRYWTRRVVDGADPKIDTTKPILVIVRKINDDYSVEVINKNISYRIIDGENVLIFTLKQFNEEGYLNNLLLINSIVYKLMNWERGIKSKKGNK